MRIARKDSYIKTTKAKNSNHKILRIKNGKNTNKHKKNKN